jgi:hypothetical protein
MNQYLAPIGNQGLRIVLMFIADTGTYDQQFQRPFQASFDRDAISALQERVATGAHIVPGSLAGVLNGQQDYVIAPQVQPEKPIQIVNGWNEHKFRWLAIAENTDRLGVKTYELVTGFTDYRGISFTGELDPNMVFYIGNILTLRHTNVLTPGGNRTYFNVADASQLLVADEWQGVSNAGFRLRPTDLFTAMDRTHLEQDMLDQGITDTRNMVTGQAVKSRRSNGVGTAYAAGIIENYKNARTMDQYGQSEDMILDFARTNTLEAPLTNDMFIRAVARERGVPITAFFTWQDLCRVDPNVQNDQITKVVLMGSPREIVNTDMNDVRSGRNNEWGVADRPTQLATILQQAVPGIMMELALSGVVFRATNRTIGGGIHIEVLNWQDFPSLTGAQIDMSEFIQAFKHRLQTEVLIDLSFSGQADFAMHMEVDLLGETVIELEWNGGELKRWVVPSFADALLTPLVTGDIRRPTWIAKNFQGVFDGVLGTSHTEMPEGNDDMFTGGGRAPAGFPNNPRGGNNSGQGGFGLI